MHSTLSNEPRAALLENRFVVLLGGLILLMLSAPLVRDFGHNRFPGLASVVTNILFSAMLLSAAFAVARTRLTLIIVSALAVPSFVLHARAALGGPAEPAVATHVLDLLYLGCTAALVLRHLFRSERVTVDVISASVCVYLLLGVLWAVAYSLLETLDPGSFLFAFAAGDEARSMSFGGEESIFPLYFSFVTMSTLGYGDILPASSSARMFATVEAIMGQIYLTVLVARLVGLQIAHSTMAARTREQAAPSTPTP